MQGDRSVASKLIYQLKMCMDRLEKFSAPTSIRSVDDNSGKKVSKRVRLIKHGT